MERMSAFVIQGHLWYPGTKEQKIAFWSRVLKIPLRFDEFLGGLPGLNCTLSYDLLQQRATEQNQSCIRDIRKMNASFQEPAPNGVMKTCSILQQMWQHIWNTVSRKLIGLTVLLRACHICTCCLSSVHFSCSVMSDSLWPHESQHARPPCPSPTPGVHTNSCPSSWWCHPAISSSVVPFSSCPQSLPASGSFPMSQFFTWGGQSIGVSALASFLSMNTQDWSPLGWTGWISLQSKGFSRVFSNTTVQNHQFFGTQPSSQSNSHIHTWPKYKP